MRTYVKWTEEELQTFYDLLKDHCVIDAARIHAENTGRSLSTILSMFYKKKHKNSIPRNILNNIPISTIYWAPKEEKELLSLVEKYPHCLKEAFRIHASNTGRSVKAVQEYFHRIRKLEDTKVCMVTIGGKAKSFNRKNVYPGTGGTIEPVKKSIWKKILSLLFG